MAIFRFFKPPQHQQYDYKPRYWDPKEEELQERLNRIERVKEGDPEAIKARLSGSFRRGFEQGQARFRKQQAMRSNLVLLGVLVALLFLSYLFITVYLPDIAASVGG